MLTSSNFKVNCRKAVKSLILWCAMATVSLSVSTAYAQEAPSPFEDGQNIVFYGDSITHGGWYLYYVQLFYATRFPERLVTVTNSGISGASAQGSLKRIDYDVLKKNPDQVYVMFGMNDVGRSNYKNSDANKKTLAARKKSLTAFESSMAETIRLIQVGGALPVVVLPSPYDQYGTTPSAENLTVCNDGLTECAAIGKKLAIEAGVPFVDLHTPMTELLKKYPELNLCGRDRVHPGKTGHMVMAYLILQAQGLGREPIGAIIDFTGKTPPLMKKCQVKNIKTSGSELEFDYRPGALPFPVFKEYTEAAELVDWNELNKEMLKINNLPPGDYSLSIDGGKLGVFSAEQFKQGINMALLQTPQAKMAQEVFSAVNAKAGIDRNLRRMVQVEGMFENGKERLSDPKAREQLLKDRLEKINPQYKNYYAGVFEGYSKLADSPDLERKAMEAQARIYTPLEIKPCRVEIKPVNN